ncbi:pyrroloquinoline quinone biosynthesis protein PqqE [Microcoleus sp. B5-C4]|jgi:pyrroloquinoline quinone biosynthesis protein E|uniref:pyrroloquinoline quinone biosynthesis protein PqqE n=1 Tax=Microcoleus sp. B5-C4 TaxID=2818675 RepID=UPI002FD17336
MNEIALPFSLVAELTYRCPLRCPYCSNPINWSDNSYQQELQTEDWLRVIRQARKLGILQLGLTGGEPLLRKDLEILVETAAELGLYTTLVTAGTLLTKERAANLKNMGLDHVQISIQDSLAAQSDRIAGARSFDQKIAASQLVKELGLPLTLNFVLHRQNLDRLEEMLSLAEMLQADRVELANTQYYGWALHNRDALLPTREQLARAEQVVKAAQQRRKIPMGILYVIPDYYAQYPKPCMGGWGNRTLIITPNGDGLPCQAAMAIPDIEFGNIRDRALDWIWFESAGMNRFRGTNWMPEPCQSCDRKTLDWGGCRCQAFLLTQDARATDPVCHLSPQHSQIRSVLDRLSVHKEDFVYRDRSAGTKGFN